MPPAVTSSTLGRKSHKKSRRGCARCKQRHVKCDESKPSCQNCIANEIRCSYLDTHPAISPLHLQPTTTTPPTPAPSYSSVTSSTITGRTVPSQPNTSNQGEGILNLTHLELMHQFQIRGSLWRTMGMCPGEEEHKAMTKLLEMGFSHPYLLHEILSFSALHLSVIHPEQRDFYIYHATELQLHALSLFNHNTPTDTTTDPLPAFFFSALLGCHNLHDALSSSKAQDFGCFIDKLVRYLSVARGVLTQIDGPGWHGLRDTPFRGIFDASSNIPSAEDAIAPELDELESNLRSADVSSSSLRIYNEALRHLKSAYHAHREGDTATGISAIFTFPIRVSVEFTDLLAQRRPEALAILAHFGALIHLYKDCWVFGDGGRCLVLSIMRFLGTYWESWLVLPRRVLGMM